MEKVLGTDYLTFRSLPIFSAPFRTARLGAQHTVEQVLNLVEELR